MTRYSRIAGTGSYLPPNRVGNEALVELTGAFVPAMVAAFQAAIWLNPCSPIM